MGSIPVAMQKVVLFLDYANIDRAARDYRYDLNYEDFLEFIGDSREGRFLLDAYCYLPIDPRNPHKFDREIEELWSHGYLVRTKVGTIVGTPTGNTYRCNLDIEITMDVLKAAYQIKPDIIVLATGDADFVPLVEEVRGMGIRVEVVAFNEAAARELILKSSGFISLNVYCGKESLPQQNGRAVEEKGDGEEEEDSAVGEEENPIEEVFQKLRQSQMDDFPEEADQEEEDNDDTVTDRNSVC